MLGRTKGSIRLLDFDFLELIELALPHLCTRF